MKDGEILDKFFYKIKLVGHSTGEIKGINLNRIHHRYDNSSIR